MEYAQLGDTGVTVSRIGFGGAAIGLTDYLAEFDPTDPATRADVVEAVEAALAGGINHFDTAPGYGDGTGERLLGDALAGVATAGDLPVFVSSKVTPDVHNRDDLRRSVEASLHRLRRDRLDLLQIHGDSFSVEATDRILDPNGLASLMLDLKAEGVVSHVGFTSEDANDSVYRLIRSGAFDTMQICYNLLFQHPYEPSRPFGCILAADEAGMGVLTMRSATSGTLQRWIRIVNPADDFDYTPALIQFVLSNPYVDVALVGMRTAAEVRANLALADDREGRIDLGALHGRYVRPIGPRRTT
jgi:aryl-alcohol dehydrogenase-like predicted oxidoreductase